MHASEGGSNSPPPFLTKTYDMVEDRANNDIVSWSPTNDSFVVRNVHDFSRDLLPKYFRHNNFSSFVRQLNTYGFRKIDPNQWEFANDEFVRGQRDLLKNIHRRKPIHSHSLNHQVSSTPLTETERQELEEKIGGLKYDKSILLMELKAHVVEEHDMDHRMHVLEERLHVMEHRQKQLIAFLGHVLCKDSFPSNAIHLYETHGKKRRLLKPCYVGNDCGLEEDKIVNSQAMGIEKVDATSVLFLESEMMESSLNSLENFFRRVSHVSGEAYDCDTADGPSVVITQLNTLLGNNDVNLPLESRELSSSFCFDGQSPTLLDSIDYADSPVSSPIEFHVERSKLSEMDVNSEPSVPEEPSVCNRVEESASSFPSGANDVFWEHFLTEFPGSSSTEVFQPRSRDLAKDSSKVIFDALRSILTT